MDPGACSLFARALPGGSGFQLLSSSDWSKKDMAIPSGTPLVVWIGALDLDLYPWFSWREKPLTKPPLQTTKKAADGPKVCHSRSLVKSHLNQEKPGTRGEWFEESYLFHLGPVALGSDWGLGDGGLVSVFWRLGLRFLEAWSPFFGGLVSVFWRLGLRFLGLLKGQPKLEKGVVAGNSPVKKLFSCRFSGKTKPFGKPCILWGRQMAVAQKVPKWPLGKWNQRPKPA